jgi:hypothetical protein
MADKPGELATKPSVKVEVDRRNALSTDTFIFALEEWDFVEDKQGRIGLRTQPRPGTWSPAVEGMAPGALSLACCPACKTVVVFDSRVHTIDYVGKLTPDFRHQGCNFARKAYLDKWNKKPLYACVIERWSGGRRWVQEIIYCHAKDETEARFHLGPGNYRIVGVAPAIGALAASDKDDGQFVADVSQLKPKQN